MFGKSISISNIKEFKATEEYLGLDEMDRKCQNREPYENCTSRLYLEAIQKECNCVPYALKNFSAEESVSLVLIDFLHFYFILLRSLPAIRKASSVPMKLR